MAAIWQHDDQQGWRLLAPADFPDEAKLHDLVEEAPQLLPLSGSPRLTVLGREVRLGSSYADLLAVERSGRLAVIEIKLARNAEARRAVVAQVLAYAAQLYGLTLDELERDVLGRQLQELGHGEIGDLVAAEDQAGGFDRSDFRAAMAESLASGSFRLVFVLDEAPEELVRLVGYLEAVTPELVIDLITVGQYRVGASSILVPQRVDPERQEARTVAPATRAEDQGHLVSGVEDFSERIAEANPEAQDQLRKLYEWATALDSDGLVDLNTYHGKSGMMTVLPRVPAEGAGLVTIWYSVRGGSVQFWRSVFERAAPGSIDRVEAAAHPTPVGQGTSTTRVSEELLDALTEAYREAAQRATRSRT